MYDQTRALSPQAMARVVEMLATELRERRTLEVGVGSGRMALPLAAAGVPLTGADLSRPMLARLVANAGGRAPFPLVQADAAQMPFGPGTFQAALACHVLHLIPPWRGVLEEVIRVVRPGGVFLVDWGGWGTGVRGQVVGRFIKESGLRKEWVGAQSIEQVEGAMRDLGASVRLLPRVPERRIVSVEHLIQLLEGGVFSFTWRLDEDARRAAADGVRRWATARFGPPGVTEPRATSRLISWRAFDLP